MIRGLSCTNARGRQLQRRASLLCDHELYHQVVCVLRQMRSPPSSIILVNVAHFANMYTVSIHIAHFANMCTVQIHNICIVIIYVYLDLPGAGKKHDVSKNPVVESKTRFCLLQHLSLALVLHKSLAPWHMFARISDAAFAKAV